MREGEEMSSMRGQNTRSVPRYTLRSVFFAATAAMAFWTATPSVDWPEFEGGIDGDDGG